MNYSEILIYSLVAIALIGAAIAFIKTPKNQRYGYAKHVKDEGVEYALEYTMRGRVEVILWKLARALPLFIGAKVRLHRSVEFALLSGRPRQVHIKSSFLGFNAMAWWC
jgi:hypothetical protein